MSYQIVVFGMDWRFGIDRIHRELCNERGGGWGARRRTSEGGDDAYISALAFRCATVSHRESAFERAVVVCHRQLPK